jgi:mRNA interferase MazF
MATATANPCWTDSLQPRLEAPLFRIVVNPSQVTGLQRLSSLMVDEITTVPKWKVGDRIGCLDDEDIVRLNRAILVFLGLAGTPSQDVGAVPAGA